MTRGRHTPKSRSESGDLTLKKDFACTVLQDGKVASKFTFTTLLEGASPRDPRTLDTGDECAWLFLSCLIKIWIMAWFSSTLHRVPSGFGSDLTRVCCIGTSSYTQCWKLGLWSVGISWREGCCYRRRVMGVDGRRNNNVSQVKFVTIRPDSLNFKQGRGKMERVSP